MKINKYINLNMQEELNHSNEFLRVLKGYNFKDYMKNILDFILYQNKEKKDNPNYRRPLYLKVYLSYIIYTYCRESFNDDIQINNKIDKLYKSITTNIEYKITEGIAKLSINNISVLSGFLDSMYLYYNDTKRDYESFHKFLIRLGKNEG